jgi:hypothetical protein
VVEVGDDPGSAIVDCVHHSPKRRDDPVVIGRELTRVLSPATVDESGLEDDEPDTSLGPPSIVVRMACGGHAIEVAEGRLDGSQGEPVRYLHGPDSKRREDVDTHTASSGMLRTIACSLRMVST